MSGLPRFSSQALAGSSEITQVIERLTVPCCGIGSMGLVVEQAAVPRRRSRGMSRASPRLRTAHTVARGGYERRGADRMRDALPGLRLSA